jgi:hypothetical protein
VTGRRRDYVDHDHPIDFGDLVRAWPRDAMAACIRCSFLIYRILRHPEFKAVTAIAFSRSEEVLAENIGFHGSQAMIAVERIDLIRQIRPCRVPAPTADGPGKRRGRVNRARNGQQRHAAT